MYNTRTYTTHTQTHMHTQTHENTHAHTHTGEGTAQAPGKIEGRQKTQPRRLETSAEEITHTNTNT
jgi:hypothetical protein